MIKLKIKEMEIDSESAIKIMRCLKINEPEIYEKIKLELVPKLDKILNKALDKKPNVIDNEGEEKKCKCSDELHNSAIKYIGECKTCNSSEYK